MSEHQSSYRQIVKATSLFGGVQVFNIIISVIKSKFVAILLGPAGMGIMGLLISTTGLISKLTNFGLGISAVKDIAAAYGANDEKRIEYVATVIRKMVWITGILGLLITAILSPWLSQLTFGNKDYTYAFLWLALTLLFDQLSSGQLVVLQGLRKLKYLAKANLFGSFLGLFISVPLYYFLGVDGIVPGIIGTAMLSLLVSWYYSGKVKLKRTDISLAETISESKNMLSMGFLISLSGLLSVGVSYVVRIFIGRTGGLEQVGLYSAGFAIIDTYVGLIFKAMSTDYYPRLSAIAHDNGLCRKTINQQAEIAILIMAPILIVFIIFINWVVILLYSKRFIDVNAMIYWAALGMFFKAASWSVAFILLAKGAGKLFFVNEIIAKFYLLSFNLLGYHFWGLTGLGLSFAVSFLIYTVQIFVVSKIKYEFTFDQSFITIFAIQFSLALAAFIVIKLLSQPLTYIIGLILILFSVWFSFVQLNKLLGLVNLLNQFMQNQIRKKKFL
jgi:O-antigen/teichoic acid export membrane protein